jgi:hypothetical protein
MTPDTSTTPLSTTGMAIAMRSGRLSRRKSQASTATNTTWVLPSTVASPAPTSAMVWWYSSRSTAKKMPASHARRTCDRGRGPNARRSATAMASRNGSA